MLQLKVMSLVDQSSYVPLKDVTIGGIIMVRHVKAGTEEEQLVEPVAGNFWCYLLYNKHFVARHDFLLGQTFL